MIKYGSLQVTLANERLQLLHGDAYTALLHLTTHHGLLDNRCNFLSGLGQHFVHILSHRVGFSQVFRSTLSCFGVGVEGSLVLLKEFLLDCDVVVGNAEHNHAVFGLSLLGESTLVFIFIILLLAHLGD